MRKTVPAPQAYREKSGITRFMLVGSPQDPMYAKYVIVYAYMTPDADGASFTGWVYDNVDIAMEYCREEIGIADSAWTEIPDQVPGALDEWIAPVRVKRSPTGAYIYHQWQRLTPGGVWVDHPDSAGLHSVQIDPASLALPTMKEMDQKRDAFFARLEQSKGVVLAYFCYLNSPDDSSMQEWTPIIDEVERKLVNVVSIWRLDNIEFAHACHELRTRTVPALILFKDGKEIGRPEVAVFEDDTAENTARLLARIDEILGTH